MRRSRRALDVPAREALEDFRVGVVVRPPVRLDAPRPDIVPAVERLRVATVVAVLARRARRGCAASCFRLRLVLRPVPALRDDDRFDFDCCAIAFPFAFGMKENANLQ
jgi:hypothetical protein